MKAMGIEKFGGVDQIKKIELPQPIPTETEILIEIEYAGVNPVDWKIRKGILKGRGIPHQFPIILGWDAAGTVAAVGKRVSRFKVGERVFAYCRRPVIQWGTYAEFITIGEEIVALMPKNIGFAEAAAVPLAALTAWQSLFNPVVSGVEPLKKGETMLRQAQHGEQSRTILIHAGAGGVGGFAIQFARNAGARKIYTTASQKNHDYVKSFGADLAIDYTKQNFVTVIQKLEPNGIDVVYDTVGGKVERESLDVLKPGGRLVGIVQPPNQKEADAKKIRTRYAHSSPHGAQLAEIAQLIESGRVQPPEILEMPLEEAARAHQMSESGHVRGKIVLKVKNHQVPKRLKCPFVSSDFPLSSGNSPS